jgi:hypothetical protein
LPDSDDSRIWRGQAGWMGNPRGLDPSIAVAAGRDDEALSDAGFAFDGVCKPTFDGDAARPEHTDGFWHVTSACAIAMAGWQVEGTPHEQKRPPADSRS